MGPKAMLLLAGLAQEAELLHVLRSLLQPPDYACLVAIARRAVSRHSAISTCIPLLGLYMISLSVHILVHNMSQSAVP